MPSAWRTPQPFFEQKGLLLGIRGPWSGARERSRRSSASRSSGGRSMSARAARRPCAGWESSPVGREARWRRSPRRGRLVRHGRGAPLELPACGGAGDQCFLWRALRDRNLWRAGAGARPWAEKFGMSVDVSGSPDRALILTAMRMGAGTGDGNRTRVSSLGSSRSTIELHPQICDRGKHRWMNRSGNQANFKLYAIPK